MEYRVSKVKWDENNKKIFSMMTYENNDGMNSNGEEKSREWIVRKLQSGYIFKCIYKTEATTWTRGSQLRLHNGSLKWDDILPLIQTKRKTFISYYHKDDSEYKKKFLNLTSDLIVSKSVEDGDISSDVSDEYVKQLIQKGYLSDTTVLVVLLSAKTKCRKHVDWEISGALNRKVGNSYAGLIGLLLPSHPDYGKDTYNGSLVPARLYDNLQSGYAIIRDYTIDRKKLQEYIELAHSNRKINTYKRVNSRIQMPDDTCH